MEKCGIFSINDGKECLSQKDYLKKYNSNINMGKGLFSIIFLEIVIWSFISLLYYKDSENLTYDVLNTVLFAILIFIVFLFSMFPPFGIIFGFIGYMGSYYIILPYLELLNPLTEIIFWIGVAFTLLMNSATMIYLMAGREKKMKGDKRSSESYSF